jgi:hypothetical protein
MRAINARTTLAELAALVSQALERAGITATLSGGAAVSLYTNNKYQSFDLDFVSSERVKLIGEAIAPLGFQHVAGCASSGIPTLRGTWSSRLGHWRLGRRASDTTKRVLCRPSTALFAW